MPAPDNRAASGGPACPVPMMMASKRCVMALSFVVFVVMAHRDCLDMIGSTRDGDEPFWRLPAKPWRPKESKKAAEALSGEHPGASH
ncbi:hypothetical protein PSUB009319_02990 [Ralstonia sp. SET104]|nr:hypothetical protein PSUB009319_02990 [Ralstonia sp. SET104]